MASRPRSAQLDGLRAIAVGAVLWSHFADPESGVGTFGVRLFFVLSGYLITGMLLEARECAERREPTRILNFYIRRALRLLPAFYLVLGLMLLLDVQGIRAVAPWHLLHASNLLFALRGDYVPWTTAAWWSLAVEEQFYLLWPLAVILLPRRGMVWLCLLLIPAAFAWRLAVEQAGWPVQARLLLPGSIDALGAGALIALAAARYRVTRWGVLAGGLGALAIWAGAKLAGVEFDTVARSLDLLVLVPVVLIAARWGGGLPGRLLAIPPLVALGRISYGIYLFHLPVWYGLMQLPGGWRLEQAGPLALAIAGSVTVAVAALSWFLIETPANRLKRHFPFPSPARIGGKLDAVPV